MNNQNRGETINGFLSQIFQGKEMMLRWDNHEHTKFWYDEKTDSFEADCNIYVKIAVDTKKLSTSLILDKIYELEDKVWDYYNNTGVKLESEW